MPDSEDGIARRELQTERSLEHLALEGVYVPPGGVQHIFA